MIFPIDDPEEFSKICLDAWFENTDFWNTTRVVNEEVKEYILKAIPNSARSLIDIGCGNGWLYQELVSEKKNLEYSGLDYNIQFIKGLTQKYSSNNFYHVDFSHPLDNHRFSCFDVVVSCLSIIEIVSLEIFFKNVQSILASDGYFILITLNPYFEIIRLNSDYNDLQSDFATFRKDKAPKFYRKEITIEGKSTGRFYYGVLHTLESLIQQFLVHNLSIVDFRELIFEDGAITKPLYHAYTLKLIK